MGDTTQMRTLATLSDVLSHPAWTAGATVLAIVAIALTIALYKRSRSRRTLAYYSISVGEP